ncbi:type I restriction endonuclease subunit R [Flammeovirga aprica]|uniref:Type I restriction endonuclease subunit R n=1 Tax=Flammeovirga aprica JL-4 TaxID=694437 RepID=A0A7X9NZ99_9BACT|nr:type I restriction endonuclease [Flammeovirga aprica]NME66578.1 type I restriction endonuclease subunit R [Flammeovirga aprica JL-4]
MPSQTNEQALEALIEKYLAGSTQEERKEQADLGETPLEYITGNGYYVGYSTDFNTKFALDEKHFWNFLETSQKEELEKLKKHSDYKLRVLDRFDKLVKKHGVLHLLRKGLGVEDAHFTLFYEQPLESSGDTVKDNYLKNQFSITRQVYFHQTTRESIDVVLFLNGLPIVTMELKNEWTGQRANPHAINQYKKDRDIKQPLLQFGRCLVHFAVDTSEVYMTTKLAGKGTFFLPFNKGNNNGAGNPPNLSGHKTDYLWKEVLTKDSLSNIIQHFMRMDGDLKTPLSKRTLFFPRYHQMDVVRKLIDDAHNNGTGQTYLIQHSAGSGKSNSITWAAYQLIEVYPKNMKVTGAKALDRPLFDSVIVVTDRRILDQQLRDNIRGFSTVKNIIAPAYSSKDLKEGLENGKKIIITTIQKFPFIIDGISDLSDKRFAVIIDEAHSSQGGVAAGKMNQAMGAGEVDEVEDTQDKILQIIKARKMRENASYLAFTATPKAATLERFGIKQSDGRFLPFHLYSMKQAIEEGFILDVLANYTTYKSYYEVEKSIEDNPEFDKSKAQKKLKNFVEKNPQTIKTKAEIMVDHFMTKVVAPKKLKGKAKAMVVTQDIVAAIRYYQAIRSIIKGHNNSFKIAIAFSGEKVVDGVTYTEEQLNGFPEQDTKKNFDTDEYRILVVANKYLTGFDQPKLSAMYVDKKLQSVLAVQALSRLNRSANKYGKRTEDLFILDFFNSADEIKKSFDPFFTVTSLSSATDVNVLHDLKEHLDEIGVYENHEVEEFVDKYFCNVDADELSPIIDVSAHRFNSELALEDDEKADFKIKAKQFVKIYSQMSAIMSYEMPAWEKLFWFLKFLIPKLIVRRAEDQLLDDLLDSVDLSSYGLERTRLNEAITLDDALSELDPQNPNPRGTHGEEEKDLLEEIIETFNDRYFSGWGDTPEESRVRMLNLKKRVTEHPDFIKKFLENPDDQNKLIAFQKIMDEVMAEQRRKEINMYKNYIKDDVFKSSLVEQMMRVVGRE